MRSSIIAATLLSTTLVASAAPAQRPSETYRAAGTEPFWSVTIENGVMRYEAPGSRPMTVRAPIPRPSFNGMRYETREMTVDVTRSRCSDGMSDRIFPDSVTVTMGRRTLRGCGGTPITGEASAIDGAWRVRSIDGKRPVGMAPTINFGRDRISGNSGCNSFNGSFRFERGRLTAGPLAATKRACPGPAMRQEARLLELLGQRLTVSTGPGNSRVMTARNGDILVIEPVRR